MAELFDTSFLKKLELLTIAARRAFRGQMRGEQRSTRTGASVEFADYRQYTQGDDYRRIDWNAFARFENLFLKLFREEEDLHLYLLCDASGSMDSGEPNKFDHARKIAAALAYIALNNQDRVSLYLLGRRDDEAGPVADSMGPRRGKGSAVSVFEFLRSAKTGGQADLTAAVRFLLARRSRPGVAVICSDMLLHGGYEDAIKLLTYEKFQTMIIHVMAPQELEPTIRGDVRLVDCENGARVDISTTKRVMAMYTAHLASFREKIEEFASKTGVDYVFASTASPFEDLVLQWMRRANMLT